MTTITEIKTAADLDALFDAAATKTVEFDSIQEARDYILANGLPFEAYTTLERNENGTPTLCSVTLP